MFMFDDNLNVKMSRSVSVSALVLRGDVRSWSHGVSVSMSQFQKVSGPGTLRLP